MTTAPAAGSYRLTTKFIAVGQKALSSLNIIHIAAPHLEALNIATGETINFSSREDDHAILIYKLEPTTGMLRTRAYIGQHMPLYCSAMGKIYMAFGHPDYVKSYWESHQHEIQPLTRNTITELPAMFDGADALLGSWAKVLRVEIFHTDSPFLLAMLPPGAFIGLGLMLAGKYLIDERMKKRRAEAAAERALPNGETGNV